MKSEGKSKYGKTLIKAVGHDALPPSFQHRSKMMVYEDTK